MFIRSAHIACGPNGHPRAIADMIRAIVGRDDDGRASDFEDQHNERKRKAELFCSRSLRKFLVFGESRGWEDRLEVPMQRQSEVLQTSSLAVASA